MITLADLQKLPPSPELFALMRREWPLEQRRKAAQRALLDDGVQVAKWEAEWILEQLPKDPPAVIAARRMVLENALDGHRSQQNSDRNLDRIMKEAS